MHIHICCECFTLRRAWPLIPTCEAFLGAHSTSQPMRKLVGLAREHNRDPSGALPAFMKPGSVHADMKMGLRLEVKYGIYTMDDFMKRYMSGPQSLKLHAHIIQLPQNQELQPESVVAVPGDLSAPRILSYFVELSCSLEEDMLGQQLREGQPADRMTWLANRDISTRAPVCREKDRNKFTTAQEIQAMADKMQEDRKKQEVSNALRGAGITDDEGASSMAGSTAFAPICPVGSYPRRHQSLPRSGRKLQAADQKLQAAALRSLCPMHCSRPPWQATQEQEQQHQRHHHHSPQAPKDLLRYLRRSNMPSAVRPVGSPPPPWSVQVGELLQLAQLWVAVHRGLGTSKFRT